MSTKSFFAAFAIAALVTPVFADVPDGHGGRTSPSALLNKKPAAMAAAHACCDKPSTHKTGPVVTNPAELKSMGHLASVSRANDPKPGMACYKTFPVTQVVYNSPAERKALGHLAVPGNISTSACCVNPRCPMHPVS